MVSRHAYQHKPLHVEDDANQCSHEMRSLWHTTHEVHNLEPAKKPTQGLNHIKVLCLYQLVLVGLALYQLKTQRPSG
jgi:hypothetical protein